MLGSGGEHLIAAPRCLYRHAVDDGHIDEADNPARTVPKPRRLHTETACRRGGAPALLPADLDPDQCLIRLRKKAKRCAGNRSPPPSCAGPGDSGGAVFDSVDGWATVRALGSITGGGPIGGTNYMLFQDYGTATRDFPGLSLN